MANDIEKKLVNVRMSESLADDLREVSANLEIGQSQFIRDAVREKIAAIRSAQQRFDQVETTGATA